MKMKTVIALFCTVIMVCGCAMARKTALDISEEEVLNAETAREVALNCLSIWPILSGFIEGALGPRIKELPIQAIEAMNELDQLVDPNNDPNSYTDRELGLSLGLRVRVLISIVGEALKLYAPDVLEFVPLLF